MEYNENHRWDEPRCIGEFERSTPKYIIVRFQDEMSNVESKDEYDIPY